MKKQSSFKTSKTDWTRLRSVKDEDVVLTREHPEVDLRHIGVVRRGIRPVATESIQYHCGLTPTSSLGLKLRAVDSRHVGMQYCGHLRTPFSKLTLGAAVMRDLFAPRAPGHHALAAPIEGRRTAAQARR